MAKHSNQGVRTLLIVLLLAVCVVGGAILLALYNSGLLSAGRKEPIQTQQSGSVKQESSSQGENWETMDPDTESSSNGVDGQEWKRRPGITTILFLGIDSKASVQSNEMIGNNGRSDTMLLFILNKEDKTMQVLQISRDTIVPVDVYSDNQDYIYTGNMQINMQYAFGDSAARGCWLTKHKVSELLLGTQIDSYASLTIDGMVAMTEAMGGITLTLTEDWAEIDPSYEKGATVTMDGAMVERFVRYRDIEKTGSNDVRMERSDWFLSELFKQLKGKSSGEILRLMEAAGDSLYTDMDAETIANFSRYTLVEETLKVPGVTVEGTLHDEYHVDEELLREMVLELFYIPNSH